MESKQIKKLFLSSISVSVVAVGIAWGSFFVNNEVESKGITAEQVQNIVAEHTEAISEEMKVELREDLNKIESSIMNEYDMDEEELKEIQERINNINQRIDDMNYTETIEVEEMIQSEIDQYTFNGGKENEEFIEEKYVVDTTLLSLREGAGTSSPLIKTLNEGKEVTHIGGIEERTYDWYEVEVEGGETGWVSTKYLK